MPCRCDGYEEMDAAEKAQAAHKATRVACDMRTILRRHKLLHELTTETCQWIKQHDKEDAERIAKEMEEGVRQRVKQKALDKLSLEERRVLGL